MADPNRSPPLDAAACERIRKLCLDGLSIPDIARSMGRSKAQIDKAMSKLGGAKAIRAEERAVAVKPEACAKRRTRIDPWLRSRFARRVDPSLDGGF